MSPSNLLAKFKAAYGMSLYEYYTDQRLKRARELLQSGLSILETASEIGYGNIGHFTAAFQKKFGFPPGHTEIQLQ